VTAQHRLLVVSFVILVLVLVSDVSFVVCGLVLVFLARCFDFASIEFALLITETGIGNCKNTDEHKNHPTCGESGPFVVNMTLKPTPELVVVDITMINYNYFW